MPEDQTPADGSGPSLEDRNTAIIRELIDALCRGERAHARGLFVEDAIWTCPPSMPWSHHFEGRDAIFDQYFAVDENLFETGTASYDLEIFNTVAQGAQVAVEMRHRSVGKNGQPYSTDHSLVYVLRDGLIAEVREYNDTLYLVKVLTGPPTQEL